MWIYSSFGLSNSTGNSTFIIIITESECLHVNKKGFVESLNIKIKLQENVLIKMQIK